MTRPIWIPGGRSSPSGKPILSVSKFGSNPAVGTTAEIVSELGGAVPFRNAVKTFRIKAGGDAADAAAGVGAREVTITGLDANADRVSVALATAGASASAFTENMWRVERAYVSETGTYGAANTDDIVIEDEDGNDHLKIGATYGQTRYCAFSVPAGYTCEINRLRLSVEGTKTVGFSLYQRQAFDVVAAPGMKAPRIMRAFYSLPQGTHDFDFGSNPLEVPEKSDIYLMAVVASTSSVATGNILATMYPNS